jgi:hypothetical protein
MKQIEDLDIHPCSYSQLIFDRGAQNIWWRKDSLFNKWSWENRIPKGRRLTLDLCHLPCTNINSKWIKCMRPETLKLLQERVGDTMGHAGIAITS